jgi:hypothetical protein
VLARPPLGNFSTDLAWDHSCVWNGWWLWPGLHVFFPSVPVLGLSLHMVGYFPLCPMCHPLWQVNLGLFYSMVLPWIGCLCLSKIHMLKPQSLMWCHYLGDESAFERWYKALSSCENTMRRWASEAKKKDLKRHGICWCLSLQNCEKWNYVVWAKHSLVFLLQYPKLMEMVAHDFKRKGSRG